MENITLLLKLDLRGLVFTGLRDEWGRQAVMGLFDEDVLVIYFILSCMHVTSYWLGFGTICTIGICNCASGNAVSVAKMILDHLFFVVLK